MPSSQPNSLKLAMGLVCSRDNKKRKRKCVRERAEKLFTPTQIEQSWGADVLMAPAAALDAGVSAIAHAVGFPALPSPNRLKVFG
ncbi:hypothetical protein ACLKA6_002685 [Drosophila palustris]